MAGRRNFNISPHTHKNCLEKKNNFIRKVVWCFLGYFFSLICSHLEVLMKREREIIIIFLIDFCRSLTNQSFSRFFFNMSLSFESSPSDVSLNWHSRNCAALLLCFFIPFNVAQYKSPFFCSLEQKTEQIFESLIQILNKESCFHQKMDLQVAAIFSNMDQVSPPHAN